MVSAKKPRKKAGCGILSFLCLAAIMVLATSGDAWSPGGTRANHLAGRSLTPTTSSGGVRPMTPTYPWDYPSDDEDDVSPSTIAVISEAGAPAGNDVNKPDRKPVQEDFKELSCPSLNINTQDRRDVEVLKSIGSAEECSKKCREKTTCNFWSWHHKDAGKWALDCLLMLGYGYIASDNNVISGSRTCNPGGEKNCCLIKTVLSGPLKGVYDLKGEGQDNADCMDDCVYTRDVNGEDYCFSSVPTFPVECTDKDKSGSVFLIAGGYSAERDIELYHPTIENLNCPTTPPPLNDDWVFHSSFYYNQTIHLCGGEKTKSSCISYSRKMSDWKTHSLSPYRISRHSSVVLRNILYLIGGVDSNDDFIDSVSTPLPLTDTPVLTTIHSLSNAYKGWGHCSMEVDQENLLIIGGYYQGSSLSTVTQYNISTHTAKALPSLRQERYGHACIMVQRDNKKWVIVTAGYFTDKLDTTEMLELGQSTWISAGRLNVKRTGVSMVDTERGIMVIGGWSRISSVELMDWSTKRWSLVQPSIKIGRHHYTATEIPLSMFDCVVGQDETEATPITCPTPTPVICPECPTSAAGLCPTPATGIYPMGSSSVPQGTVAPPITTGCSDAKIRVVTHDEEKFHTPGFPEINYEGNQEYCWRFKAKNPNEKLSVSFSSINTEYGYDTITIYEGNANEEKKRILLITSGNVSPDNIISNTNEITISFRTDVNEHMKGFEASVTAVKKKE